MASITSRVPATNVQDEMWQLADGTFARYEFAYCVRERDFHGVYGPRVGSWYIHAGRDYYDYDDQGSNHDSGNARAPWASYQTMLTGRLPGAP